MNIESSKHEIAKLAEKYGFEAVILFGSQATGRTHPKSDIDIAILSRENFDRARLAVELSDIFKREDVEVVNLSNASPMLMIAVVIDGKTIYEKFPGVFIRWKSYAMKIWMETSWLRKLRRKQVLEWASNLS